MKGLKGHLGTRGVDAGSCPACSALLGWPESLIQAHDSDIPEPVPAVCAAPGDGP